MRIRLRSGPRVATLATLMVAALPAAAAAQTDPGLAVTIQYPPAAAAVGATDSTFVFGRVTGAGGEAVELAVNGRAVEVHPGGGWLAFVPLEPDSFTFRVVASSRGRTAAAERTVWVPRSPFAAPAGDTLGYRPETVEPRGPLELYAGDTLRVSVIAAPDADVRARLGGASLRLAPELPDARNRGRLVFDAAEPAESAWTTPSSAPADGGWRRFAGDLYLTLSGAPGDSLWLDVTRPGGPTRSTPVAGITFLDPTRVRVAILDDDTAGTGRTDHRVIVRHAPGAGYHSFLPNGTEAPIGRRMGEWREIALGPGTRAWAPLSETHSVREARPVSRIPIVRTRVQRGWSEIVVPTTARLPFDIRQRLDPAGYTVQIYGAIADVDYLPTRFDDSLLDSVVWSQPRAEVLELEVALRAGRPWGWRAYWEGTHLVIGFRHPPPALSDARFRSPLHGVRIVVDPGHNPDPGAVGPTGLEEREANLEIALELADVLTRRGAEVVLTRASADSSLGLYDRANLAIESGGEIFVSIHNNALPDGVNPFVNHGTSVLYYHPQSRPLALAIQGELLPRTGLPDRGVWHQNVAVLRMNEMPAVLVESAFMMLPDQEAALRTPEFRRRIADGVAAGIERFLREGKEAR